jgi:hypothetical protein
MFTPVGSLLDNLRGVLDQLGAVDWRASDPDAVARAAVGLAQGADRLEAISLLAIAEHDRRGGVVGDGDGSLGDWTSRQTRSSVGAGKRKAARAKRMAKAAKTARAAAEGRLSSEQADRLASARTEENAERFDAVEDQLIARAEGSLEAAIKAAEEFRAATGESAQDRADRLWRRRKAANFDDEDGVNQHHQSIPGDAGAAFKSTFDAYVDREHANCLPGDARTREQIRADAAVALGLAARAWLETNEPSRASRFQAQVLVRYEDLVGDQVADWAGEVLQTGQPLTGHAVRRLCCDAGIVRIVTQGDSQVIDVGRLTRSIPVPTERAVLARDGHRCTYPGCHARDGLQVHHLKHWGHLGPTDLDNLACLCWRHHRLVHEGGWQVTYDKPTGRTIWHAPDGRRLIGQRRATTDAKRHTTAA